MSNPKPLYTITPEQEKAVLNEVIMRFDDESQSYLLKHQSLSSLVNDDVVPLDARQDIVGVTLWNLAFDSFFNGDPSYSSLKNHFAKYANQSLVGTIAGVSITPQDFQKLITNDNVYVFVDSLPFSFMNEIEDRDQLFEKLNYQYHPEILLLNHYKFTDEQYKIMIKFGSLGWEPGYLTLFAACPQTKHLVTQENFAEEWYMVLYGRANDDAPHINYEHELTEAYRDLFNEEFVINTESF
jgi:hypothetical protein